jgi:subtilisin family serine protease
VGIVGIAPGAILSDGNITGDGATTAWQNAAASIINLAAPETKVISISYSSKLTYEPPDFALLHDAVINAYYQRGMIIVASTGNESSATIQSYPARWTEVIGVGGSGYSDEYVYNNYAPGNVEIAAPAVDVGVICQGGGTQGTASGTSFATPLVAGAVMLLRQKYPTNSNDWIRARLQNTALPMANSQQSGAGRLDVLAALDQPPTYTATIAGASEVQPYAMCSWSVSTNLPSPPLTYAWWVDGVEQSGGSEWFTWTAGTASFTLMVRVTNAQGSPVWDDRYVGVSWSAQECLDS